MNWKLKIPLVKEISECVDHVGLTELTLDKRHDMWKVGLTDILTVNNIGHDKSKQVVVKARQVTWTKLIIGLGDQGKVL